MSDINSNGPSKEDTLAAHNNPFSSQPTGLVETTFAETIGLSMHNAVTNQQSSQMTTSASITNACARLLQTPAPANLEPKSKKSTPSVSTDEKVEPLETEPEIKSLFQAIKKWLGRKPKDTKADTGAKE